MQPVKVMIARFPYGKSEFPDVCDWIIGTVVEMKADPRIQTEIVRMRVDDTPITMGRNRVLKRAIEEDVDMLLMVDADMKPDAYLPGNMDAIAPLEGTQPFWATSFQHLWNQRQKGKPSIIGAPYCGPEPISNVYVFHWETRASDVPEDSSNFSLEQYSRHAADGMRGITEVAALPTGLILMDMEAVEKLDPPYTYYEWKDEGEDEKASTEDVTFTRDMSLMGVPQFCNWDAWAGHWKYKCVGRPHRITSNQIADKLKNAWKRDYNIGVGEEIVDVKSNGRNGSPGSDPKPSGDRQPVAALDGARHAD